MAFTTMSRTKVTATYISGTCKILLHMLGIYCTINKINNYNCTPIMTAKAKLITVKTDENREVNCRKLRYIDA